MSLSKALLLVALGTQLMMSCITVDEHEKQTIAKSQKSGDQMTAAMIDGFRVEYFVYNPEKWPLEDFIGNLIDGEFKRSFADIDFRYRVSNADSEALETLMDHGYVPVYVKVRNPSNKPMVFSESTFYLKHDSKSCVSALAAKNSPKWFHELNLAAIGANVHNVVMVSLLVIAVAVGDRGVQYGKLGGADGKILNDTKKTKEIDYRNFLISRSKLGPGGMREGLLFFKPRDGFSWEQLSVASRRC